MKRGISLLCAGALCLASPVRSQEAHSHPPPEKLGTIHFPTSCAPAVAHDFERAVALLHSFSYTASEQAFQAITVADPGCAMAHWGIAMTHYHPLWSPPSAEDLREGWSEARKAGVNVRTARERRFIAAVTAFYSDSDRLDHVTRASAYAHVMAEAARENPEDTEAQVFYALALIAIAPPDDSSHADQQQAAALLEPIYRAQPDHPGVAHYLIHAYDSNALAARGLAAARAYASIAPSAPHALHMPSHIFTRLGLWRDSIDSNRAARQAAHDQGDVGEELHAMDYLTYAYLQLGRDADAGEVVSALRAMMTASNGDFKVGYAAAAMPVRFAMERHQWADAAALDATPYSLPQAATLVYWARAVANSRAGHPQAATVDIAAIDRCMQQLKADGNAYWAGQTDLLGQEARAWELAATRHPDEAIALLRAAADQEEAVEKLPVTPGPVIPAREQLGDLLLERGRPKEALKEYRSALAAAPGRRAALNGAIDAAQRAGDASTVKQLRAVLAGE